MPQIISASRRTDVPAFYSDWLLNRLRAGFARVLHPYSKQWLRVSLAPDDVGAIVLWSKNFAPLLPKLEGIEKTTRNLFFHFTITGDRELELRTPDYHEAIRDFLFIARRYSPEHIIWRFDPVCITDKLPFEVTEKRFNSCAELLAGHTRACYISFVHPYRKVIANISRYSVHRLLDIPAERKQEYARRLATIAERHGIKLFACCNDHLVGDGVAKGSCIDGRRLSLLFGTALDTTSSATRKECACTRSIDIGAYDTCGHGCLYCYANTDQEKASRTPSAIDVASPTLCAETVLPLNP
jgi:hypothetical protein